MGIDFNCANDYPFEEVCMLLHLPAEDDSRDSIVQGILKSIWFGGKEKLKGKMR